LPLGRAHSWEQWGIQSQETQTPTFLYKYAVVLPFFYMAFTKDKALKIKLIMNFCVAEGICFCYEKMEA